MPRKGSKLKRTETLASISDTPKKSSRRAGTRKGAQKLKRDKGADEERSTSRQLKINNYFKQTGKTTNGDKKSLTKELIKSSTQHSSGQSNKIPKFEGKVEIIDLCSDDDEIKNDDNHTECKQEASVDPVQPKEEEITMPEELQPKLEGSKCPPYKIIEGTNFAVDAFKFGLIPNVTHYFLTHYHADHYGGLSGKFVVPIYMSPITARLVRIFHKVRDEFIHEIELNQPIMLNGVEITAIDANHCPGAVMLVFKLPNGRCILHTGDFRACAEMESEPIFWNNDINSIYLDTTYIREKGNPFCSQSESIELGIELIRQFRDKHQDKRMLFVCGAYSIGKEKFWSALARAFGFSVWTEEGRKKALDSMNLKESSGLLREKPLEADMHVISMMKISYLSLVDYFEEFKNNYDVMLAIRPSGWEKSSKPRFSSKINIVGVEYSEHSSYNELERFVTFLNPQQVVSTVPVGRNLFETAKVPNTWYNYAKYCCPKRFYQPTITSYYMHKSRKAKDSRPRNDCEDLNDDSQIDTVDVSSITTNAYSYSITKNSTKGYIKCKALSSLMSVKIRTVAPNNIEDGIFQETPSTSQGVVNDCKSEKVNLVSMPSRKIAKKIKTSQTPNESLLQFNAVDDDWM